MRTYSEDQVRAIIERAVERQHEADAGTTDAGLTLDEIERLGREAGIDPAHLRAAADEVDSAGRTLTRQAGQTRTEVFVERWVDAPLSPEDWEDVVAYLRADYGPSASAALTGDGGDTVQQVGAAYEWSHTSALGIRTRVTLSPRDGRTRLRITQLVGMGSPTTEGIGYGLIVAMIVGFIALVAFDKADAGVVTALGGSLGAFLASWLMVAPVVTVWDRRWRAGKLRKLDALADDVVPLVRHPSVAGGDREAPSPDPVPRLDLDALPDVDAAAPAQRRRDRA